MSRKKERIVFTNGCFDILHVGHIRYLASAKAKGDILIVGLNSDKSFQRIKGRCPINNEQWRYEQLMALRSVDEVQIFDEDTPYELIKEIGPDILVKGGDYDVKNIIGRDLVKKTMVISSGSKVHTSDIMRRIADIMN